LESTYEALVMSNHLYHVRNLRVRVDVARFSMGRQFMHFQRVNTQVCTFSEMGLKVCVQRLVPLAEGLCEVSKLGATRLKVVEIEWVDDFPDDVREVDLRVRKNVLKPFASLEVQVRIKKLVMTEKGRQRLMTMMAQVLQSANGNA